MSTTQKTTPNTTQNDSSGGVSRRQVLGGAAGIAAAAAASKALAAVSTTPENLPRVRQKLVPPPFAPEHSQIAEGGPKIIEVEMTCRELTAVIDPENGVQANVMTFNGVVPGPLIICHEGDYIEITLKNPEDSLFEHNIDFHASTGAMGGGELTKVQPGEQTVLRWKAVKPGTFVYHCAPGGIMVPFHVVSGMNGAVMVLPRDGLKGRRGEPVRYDRVYYIGEQDFYLPKDKNGEYKKFEDAADAMAETLDVMRGLIPSHIVFNGAVGALTGDNAMKAKVGETVLVVHAQANRDSRPHLIGGHGDYIWEMSFADPPAEGNETWFVRGGSAMAWAYKFRQPGLYAYLNHNLIEAFMLGAAAHFTVEGEWDDDLMKQVQAPTPMAG
ncbi:MAG: copper-containing nitrite reductase [Rhodospirillales bacterium]